VDWMVGLGREGREWRRMGPGRAGRMGMGEIPHDSLFTEIACAQIQGPKVGSTRISCGRPSPVLENFLK
jgi:hypothetical protein